MKKSVFLFIFSFLILLPVLAFSATKYVNFNTSSGGADDCGTWGTGNDSTGDGSLNTPWATIKKALDELGSWAVASEPDYIVCKDEETYTVTAGNRIDIGGGTYIGLRIQDDDGEDATDRLYIISEECHCGDGDPGLPSNWQGPRIDGSDTVLNYAIIYLQDSDYVTIQGFEIFNIGGNDAIIKIGNSNSSDLICTDLHIKKNWLYDSYDGIWEGIQYANHTMTIEDNYIGDDTSGMTHSSLYFDMDRDQDGPIIIKRNVIWNFAYSGIDIVSSESDGNEPAGFYVDRNLVFGGTVGGAAEHGITLSIITGSYVRSNVVLGLEGSGITLHGLGTVGSDDNYIYNNTVYAGTANGAQGALRLYDGSTGNLFKNNIFAKDNSTELVVITEGNCSTNTFDYNYYDGGNSGSNFSLDGAGGPATDFAAWQSHFGAGTETNGAEADPLFVNTGNLPDETDRDANGLMLQSSSLCKDDGVDVSISEDYLGTLIPQGANPDVGAYEYPYVPSGDNVVLIPGSNITLKSGSNVTLK